MTSAMSRATPSRRQRSRDRSPTTPLASPARVPILKVSDMMRSLDFYLALGCEVDCAADGWVQLRLGHSRLVISPATGPIAQTGASLALHTEDGQAPIHLMAMGGVLTSVPDDAEQPVAVTQVTDPDGHLLRITLGSDEPMPMTPVAGTA
ncbi:MAG: hypothetical protein ACR2G2_03290 [Pseudonocardia sp.]